MKLPIRRMFRNPELQERFVTDGFLVLPLLSESEVGTLLDVFASIRPSGEMIGIYTNFHDNSLADNLRVDRVIAEIFAKYVDRLFQDCYLAGGSLFVKGTDADSQSIPHQDWNCVDESTYTSLNLWCPLIDVDGGNGALQVVPGSHHQFDTVRSITIPSTNFTLAEIEPIMLELVARAGDAVIYAHDLFHGSRPNTSGRVRPVAVAAVLPNGADHIHYYRAPESVEPVAEVLKIDPSFYYTELKSYYSGARPEGFSSIGTKTFPPGPTLDDLRRCSDAR
jgi:ectoine hydroxylase-related dioxygenase (phytanoyl-CoA dioxygenase family)